MTDCQFVEDRLDEFLLGQLVRAEQERVDAHLAQCEACTDRLERACQLASAVDSVVDEWVPSPALKSRVDSTLRSARPRLLSRWRPVFWAPAFAVVVLAVAVGVLFVERSPAPLMDDLLVSEFNTFVASGRDLDYVSERPGEVRSWFLDKVMFRPPLPGEAEGLSLAGARLCNLADKRIASYMYRVKEGWVSLYILRSEDLGPKQQRRVGGYTVLSWTSDGLRYVLVGDVAEGRLSALAESIGRYAPAVS